jgi:hypothetical protein
MPSLNFQKQFAPAVRAGIRRRPGGKRQTIRGRAIPEGAPLYLFTGMRTKQCRRLGKATCRRCRPITIHGAFVSVDGRMLDVGELIDLAHDDGFADCRAMKDWFQKTHGLPFVGWLIEW